MILLSDVGLIGHQQLAKVVGLVRNCTSLTCLHNLPGMQACEAGFQEEPLGAGTPQPPDRLYGQARFVFRHGHLPSSAAKECCFPNHTFSTELQETRKARYDSTYSCNTAKGSASYHFTRLHSSHDGSITVQEAFPCLHIPYHQYLLNIQSIELKDIIIYTWIVRLLPVRITDTF